MSDDARDPTGEAHRNHAHPDASELGPGENVSAAAATQSARVVMVAPQSIVHQGPGAVTDKRQPPPRPAMSSQVPAPIVAEIPYTPSIARARNAWLLSIALGVAALLFAVFSSKSRLAKVRDLVQEHADGYTAATVDSTAKLLFWGSVAVLALVTASEIAMLMRLLRARSWARWGLLVTVVVLHSLAALAFLAFAAVDRSGLLITLLALAQLLVALIAVGFGLTKGARAWFAAKMQAQSVRRA